MLLLSSLLPTTPEERRYGENLIKNVNESNLSASHHLRRLVENRRHWRQSKPQDAGYSFRATLG